MKNTKLKSNTRSKRQETPRENVTTKLPQVKVHFKVTSGNAEVNSNHIKAQPIRQHLTVTTMDLGLTSLRQQPEARRASKYEQNHSLLTDYLKWLEDNGFKLPEDPKRRGVIFFTQVEIESHLNWNTLQQGNSGPEEDDKSPLRQLLKGAVARLGLEVRVLPQSPGHRVSPITYKEFEERGVAERIRELERRPNARQQMYNTRTALNRFLKSLGLEKTAPVSDEMTVNFKSWVENVTGLIPKDGTRKKFQTGIHWWHDFYQRLVKERALPADFHNAVTLLIDRSGLPLSTLAKLIGISRYGLRAWHEAKTTPCSLSVSAISRMEQLFKLPAGTLLYKIPGLRMSLRLRRSQLPEFLQQDQSLARRVIPHLPDDFCELPSDEQKEIVESIDSDIVRGNDPYTQTLMELSKLPYRLKELPWSLDEECDDLAAFKTGERPPLGMKRNERWRPTSRDKILRDLEYFFGALLLPADNEDERMCGLGVHTDDLSLALIACPLVVDWYIRFRAARTLYTEYLLNIVYMFSALLRADTGWIRQKPQLAYRLKPIHYGTTELVTRELIVKAKSDWATTCEEARAYFRQLINELKPMVRVARDPFARIEGILQRDDLMSVFKIIAEGIKNDLPNRHTRPTSYHTGIRDCVLVLLIAVTGFRLRTVSLLNYTGDDTGQLSRRGKTYVLNVPRSFFKVEDSPFFGPRNNQRGYVMEVPDVYGLYKSLDEYLATSRPFLLEQFHRGAKDEPLFVSSPTGKTVRLSTMAIYDAYRKAFTNYLVENKWRGTGIPGVRPTGSHSARHIRGTCVVKKTGSLQMAGDANHHSEEVARKHYARFLPEDRNKRVIQTLF